MRKWHGCQSSSMEGGVVVPLRQETESRDGDGFTVLARSAVPQVRSESDAKQQADERDVESRSRLVASSHTLAHIYMHPRAAPARHGWSMGWSSAYTV
jgi:hypothetical protein